jgi:NhaA family Na+:H+ antiporter
MPLPLRPALLPEAAASYGLLIAAVVAMLLANSPLAPQWAALWDYVPFSHTFLPTTLQAWVKDGLMAVFFFAVGLEIKRELTSGHLRQRHVARLPLVAALGGMAAPALIFLLITWGQPAEVVRGWAIPCATDLAFALGVLGLLGPKLVPAPLKVLLLAVAIFDDLGAMLIIAIFYAGGLAVVPLLLVLGIWAIFAGVVQLPACQRGGWSLVPLSLAMGCWLALLPSGLHPSVGAVALAAVIPAKSVLPRLEQRLRPAVALGVLPLFALAAAGVDFSAAAHALINNSGALLVVFGVTLGLLLGKPLGIVGAIWLAEQTGLAQRPTGVTWRHLAGLGAVAGIGFTLSLFIGKLAYGAVHPELFAAAKLGVLTGSIMAAGCGAWLLRRNPHAELPTRLPCR